MCALRWLFNKFDIKGKTSTYYTIGNFDELICKIAINFNLHFEKKKRKNEKIFLQLKSHVRDLSKMYGI